MYFLLRVFCLLAFLLLHNLCYLILMQRYGVRLTKRDREKFITKKEEPIAQLLNVKMGIIFMFYKFKFQ
jgi:hypothetical protein